MSPGYFPLKPVAYLKFGVQIFSDCLAFGAMDLEIDTKQIAEVQREVLAVFQSIFSRETTVFLKNSFAWTNDCFTGKYRDYQPIDARYHDLEHTLQVTLCLARLMRGWHRAITPSEVTPRLFELGILAILLHDTGYLKKRGDDEGTGAKYTLIHVERSVDFAGELLAENGLAQHEIKSVQNMIRCTGLNLNLAAIPFQSEAERHAGLALGTADLLGQMAAEDYVEKLPFLYLEFEESSRFGQGLTGKPAFSSADDMVQKTPAFWEKYVRPKMEREFEGFLHFLNEPYPAGPNRYVDQIEKTLRRIPSRDLRN